MPSAFRNRLTRPSTSSSSSSSASAASAGIGSSGDGHGMGRSFLGRRSNIGGGGGNKLKQQQWQQNNRHQRGNHNPSKHTTAPLATFDACVEACDALAASSASSSPWQKQQQHQQQHHPNTSNENSSTSNANLVPSNDSSDNDERKLPSSNEANVLGEASRSTSTSSTEDVQHNHSDATMPVVPDCSVLVSPDGALLFTSSSLSTLANPNNICRNQKIRRDDDDDAEAQGGEHYKVSSSNNGDNDRYPWTKISPENCDGAILSEEYESAVITGNDLTPHGDYDSNGFTATGWNIDAATCALSASRDVLVGMTNFVETLATCRKQEAACVRTAVEASLGDVRIQLERQWYERRRMGPMMASPETKLSAAIEAMEEYYVQSSGNEMELWKRACCSSTFTSSQLDKSTIVESGTNDADVNRVVGDETHKQRSNPPELIYGMLPKLQTASLKATTRTTEREYALSDMRSKMLECETILREQKDWASNQWKRVAEEESNIDRLYAIKKMEQHEFYENQRRRRLEEKHEDEEKGAFSYPTAEVTDDRKGAEEPLSKEVWMMVQNVTTSMEDFGHTGYSPRAFARKVGDNGSASTPQLHQHHHLQQHQLNTPSKIITRADVERESDIQDLKMVAQAADEAVEDAAGKLLNIMSKGDTTLRSARLAAESCLLSECNAARNCLRSLVAIERASLQDRLRQLDVLEDAVDAIDVRKDIDFYIRADKAIPGGRSRDGEEDGGGIAAALAILNSHGENVGSHNSPRKHRNIERPSYFEGWTENRGVDESDRDDDDVEPEIFGDVINLLFSDCPTQGLVTDSSDNQCIDSGSGKRQITPNDSKIEIASNALRSKLGNNHRKSVLYYLNNQRSKKTWVEGQANFDGLCHIFDAFLSGCGREPSDVSNAMMLMILSQTFYILDHAGEEDDHHEKERAVGSTTRERQSRIYVKSTICHHEIWRDEDFWDQAAYQCVSESLSKSGVLLNYIKLATDNDTSGRQSMKWHDLSPDEYACAATQVHSVLFAQLGTVAHSMLELGCGIPRACNFVRRLSIRYQLPLSLRVTLMQHLTKERS